MCNLWSKLLAAGDISGKIMTLIALPSAIFAVSIFFNEIGDTLTDPDVKADIQSVGLRCGPAVDARSRRDETLNAFKIRSCEAALLSAWVKLDIENEDSIDRTLASVAIRIEFPQELDLSEQPVLWDDTRVVYHILENDLQTSQRWPWATMLLAPGQRVPIEFDFRAFEEENQIPFSAFKDLIMAEESPLGDTRIPIEILGQFSGAQGWSVLGRCEIDIPQTSVDRKRDNEVLEGIFARGLTRRCV